MRGGDLDGLLGNSAPNPLTAAPRAVDLKSWRNAKVEGFWIPAEGKEGQGDAPLELGLALWVLTPNPEGGPRPVVLGLAQAGKDRFLHERAAQVETLLQAGVAVALLDVRGCGETSLGADRLPEGPSASLASVLWMQNESLPARQLKDVRTALHFLANRKDLDAQRLALWGEGFSEPNGTCADPVLFDETGFRQCTPTPKHLVEPAGGWLALTAALYPIDTEGGRKGVQPKAVLVRGTLVSFASVLERRHHYLPVDAAVPGILGVADLADVVQALRGERVEILAEDLRDGSNRLVDVERVRKEWGDAAPSAYSEFPTEQAIQTLIKLLAP